LSSLKYWVWLSVLRGLGGVKIAQLLNYFGSPEGVYSASEKDLPETARLSSRDILELQNKSFDRANEILEQCDQLGIQIITMADAGYPDRLKTIYSAPALLYVRGHVPDFDDEAALCVVGARRATPYGMINAERLSYELAMSGALVVSGMALGIDTAAHIGALKADRPTVAVLGCGLDVCYPAENRGLMQDIAARGALVSEYPPGTRALGGNFPARNRILSGLCVGTIIIEASATSGSLITANHALEQGRDVFAIPGNIDAASNDGTNSLIQQGAKLVVKASDVLEEYTALYPHKLFLKSKALIYADQGRAEKPSDALVAAQPAPRYDTKRFDISLEGLRETERLLAVRIRDRKGSVHIDELVADTGLKTSEVLSTLTILELKKIIKQLPGKYFSMGNE